jgi:hypothetical protein
MSGETNLASKLELHMSPDEAACFRDLVASSRRIIEYGSGGSTVLACRSGAKLISVESDNAWLERVLADESVRDAVEHNRARLMHIDIGPVGDWGRPLDKSCSGRWPSYSKSPWEQSFDPDLVLVDGRFRVACILQTILNARRGTTLVVHDFWNRPKYHVVLPFLRWSKSVDSLGVFTIVTCWQRKKILKMLQRYAVISD